MTHPHHLPVWLSTVLAVAAVVVVTGVIHIVAVRAMNRMAKRLPNGGPTTATEAMQRVRTIASTLRTVVTIVVWTIGLMYALSLAGVAIAPLVTAAGVGGIALGFGAQNVVRDFLAGIFILVEDQYHVGDVIEVAEVSGKVERITLRTTVLRDIRGRLHVVPNGEIRVSTNLTKGFSRYLIDLPVDYEEDIDRVIDVVTDVVDEMRSDEAFGDQMLGPLEVLGVDEYEPSSVNLRMYIDTVPGEHWRVGRELRRRLTRAYGERGITIPYPRTALVLRQNGDR